MTFINHYEILEIEANADLSAIKSAFNKLAMRYHPDRNLGDPIAEAMMKKLNQALRTLSDSKLRKEHDETLLKNKPHQIIDFKKEFIQTVFFFVSLSVFDRFFSY